jgi:hypothetical protein
MSICVIVRARTERRVGTVGAVSFTTNHAFIGYVID